jgi:hypothetical protein
MQIYSDAHSAVSLRQPDGPLFPYLSGFSATLHGQGYAEVSITFKLWLVRALDQWMRGRRLEMKSLSEGLTQQFLRDRGKRYSIQVSACAALRSLLAYLREIKVVGPPICQPVTRPIDHLQESFAQHWVEQRGLRPKSVKQYLFHTRRFLSGRFGHGELSLRELNSRDLNGLGLCCA